MNRRHFIIKAGKSFPVVAGAMYLAGCDSSSMDGGSSDSPNDEPNVMVIRATSTFDAGHSHSTEIPETDLSSTSNRTYSSSSSGGHSHQVSLTSAQLNTIGDGGEVTITSSDDAGHTHRFTFKRV